MCADCRTRLNSVGLTMHWSLAQETAERAAALDEPERRRMATLPERRRRQFVTGRWLLRGMLSRLVPAESDRFALVSRCRRCGASGHGPVEADVPGQRLYLTLAHSRDIVVAGVARTSVGVDVEAEVDHPELLEPVIVGATAEHEAIEQRRARVTRAWCRGEALAKAAGMDLSAAFALLRDSVTQAGPIEVRRRGDWTITDLPTPMPGYTLAVATGRGVGAWPPSSAIPRWQQ